MKKNDITYEYRVFTNRLIDVESMEVGNCTSKVIKEIKQKDKVDGRFFHTSDTDEWFFCWNGVLQKLNFKGNEDLNSVLDEVEKLISEANSTVEDVKKTANEAKEAAAIAKTAADSANEAVESIENKADKSDVEAVSKIVEDKADKLVVDNLSQAVATKAEQSYVKELSDKIDSIKVDDFATKSDISTKQDEIKDLDIIRSGAALGATALQSIPEEYVTETELEGKGYLTVDDANSKYAPIGSGNYATQDFVKSEIEKINIPTVPTNISEFTNDAGYLTEHQDLSEYALKSELPTVPTKVSELENNLNFLTKADADGYYAAIGSTGSGDGVAKDYVDAELAKKQDIINDIEDIRSNAALAATALQEGDLEGYVTEDELNKKGYLTEHQDLSGKQDVIENLNDIISGASAGATALQPGALDGYVTSENVYTKAEIDALIGVAKSYIKDTILA
jgi:hypothetical protein